MRKRKPAPAPLAEKAKACSPRDFAPDMLCLVQSAGLRWFRRALALAITHDAVQMAWRREMRDFFGEPGRLNFVYPAAPWARPLSGEVMEQVPLILGASAVAAAFFPRYGWLACTCVQLFLFLCEAARYVNHYYLYLMLSALLAVVSLDTPNAYPADCRRWHLLLLRLQISIVYFFGGLVKLNAEFLVRGEPLRSYMHAAARAHALGPLSELLGSAGMVMPCALFATAFDLGAGFTLWHPKLRVPTAIASLAFHFCNHLVFPTIGSFPFVSLAATALFLPPSPAPLAVARPKAVAGGLRRVATIAFGACWVGGNIMAPLRHHFLSDDVSWTKLGNDFAWRMMSDTTDGWMSVTVYVGAAARTLSPTSVPLPGEVSLPEHSISLLLASPSLLEQFVDAVAAAECARHHPAAALFRHGGIAEGTCAPRVFVDAWKSVNNRPYQRWADPMFDFGGRFGDNDNKPSTGAAGSLGDASRLAAPHVAPWMLRRLTLCDADVARVDAAANKWRRRGYAVEVFVEGTGHGPWRDQILHSSGRREALLVVLVGDVGLSFGRHPPGSEEWSGHMATSDPTNGRLQLVVGDVRPLHIGGTHHVWNRAAAAPCSWLYAMR